jgi:putative endonuclease
MERLLGWMWDGIRVLVKGVRTKSHKKISAYSKLGNMGEDLAADFLKKRNFRILKRNWVFKKGEIDIIAFDKNFGVLVFVEVKLRAAQSLVSGYFGVDERKKNILRKTCMAYLRRIANQQICYRFDIIEVQMDKIQKTHKVFHYENVKLFG